VKRKENPRLNTTKIENVSKRDRFTRPCPVPQHATRVHKYCSSSGYRSDSQASIKNERKTGTAQSTKEAKSFRSELNSLV